VPVESHDSAASDDKRGSRPSRHRGGGRRPQRQNEGPVRAGDRPAAPTPRVAVETGDTGHLPAFLLRPVTAKA
jgi:hypothetical protein